MLSFFRFHIKMQIINVKRFYFLMSGRVKNTSLTNFASDNCGSTDQKECKSLPLNFCKAWAGAVFVPP